MGGNIGDLDEEAERFFFRQEPNFWGEKTCSNFETVLSEVVTETSKCLKRRKIIEFTQKKIIIHYYYKMINHSYDIYTIWDN